MEHSASNNSKECQINAYSRTVLTVKPLAQEEILGVRCDGQWGPLASVIEETAPRSYEVITEHGQMLWRNGRHLHQTASKKNLLTKDSNTRDVTVQGHAEQPNVTNEPNLTTNQQNVAKQPDERNQSDVKDRNVTKNSNITQRDRPKRHIEKSLLMYTMIIRSYV